MQTDPGNHPGSCSIGMGVSVLGVKWHVAFAANPLVVKVVFPLQARCDPEGG